MKVTLFGTPDGVYTRIVRLILDLKAVPYDFVMADLFEDHGLPESMVERHAGIAGDDEHPV